MDGARWTTGLRLVAVASGQHAVDRCSAHAEGRRDGSGRFSARVHPVRQRPIRRIQRLRPSNRLPAGPTGLPRRERQVQRADGGAIEIRSPEYESVRIVHVPDEVLHILSEHIRLHLPDNNPDRWVFPGQGEHPLHQNSVGYLWRKARKVRALTMCSTISGTSTPLDSLARTATW